MNPALVHDRFVTADGTDVVGNMGPTETETNARGRGHCLPESSIACRTTVGSLECGVTQVQQNMAT